MKEFKKLVLVISMLLMTSCGVTISTLNNDPIYDSNRNVVEIIENEMQLDRKLRDDFNFRYDYAQYAKSQPISFDWNNRILRNNRFNFSNRYSWNNVWNYSSYLNRDQMWDDWLWGYSSMNYGMGWSYSWGSNSWSSNHWNSPYGWNNYYGWGNGYGWNNNGWNNGYRRGSNVAYNIGRRGSTMSVRDRIGNAAMIETSKRDNLNKRNFVIEEDGVRWYGRDEVVDKEVIKLKRNNPNIRVINNSKPIRNYNRIENNSNNNINRNNNNNNSRPVRTYTPPSRSSSPVRTSTTTRSRNVIIKGKPNQ